MGEQRDAEAARVEKELSDKLAEQAKAEEKSSSGIIQALENTSLKSANAILAGIGGLGQGILDVRDELGDVGETLDEKLDDVVGMIVDPIRKGLTMLGNELKPGDPLMAAGFIVGAVVSLEDEIKKGWNDLLSGQGETYEKLKLAILDGLILLGETTRKALDVGWTVLKEKVVPGIVDGLMGLGKEIWDMVPDWLQSGLKVFHKIWTWTTTLVADLGSMVLGGMETIFRALGFDTLADTMSYLSDVLDALSEWLDPKTDKEQAAEEAAAAAKGTDVFDVLMGGGNKEAKAIFKEARKSGLGVTRATHLAALGIEDANRGAAVLEAFRAAIAAGMSPVEAQGIAKQAALGGGAQATSLGSAATDDIDGVAAQRAASLASTVATNAALKQIAMVAGASKAGSTEKSPPNVLDNVSVADPVAVFSHGMMGGGIQ